MFELREHGWMWKVTPSGKRFQVSEFRHQSIYLFGSLTFFQISKRTNQIHIIPSRSACVTLSFKTNAVTESELLPDSSTFLLASLRSLIEMQKKKHSADFRREGPLTPACVPPFLTPNLHCYRYQSCNLTFFGDRLFCIFFIFFSMPAGSLAWIDNCRIRKRNSSWIDVSDAFACSTVEDVTLRRHSFLSALSSNILSAPRSLARLKLLQRLEAVEGREKKTKKKNTLSVVVIAYFINRSSSTTHRSRYSQNLN